MGSDLRTAIKNRHSNYDITSASPISDAEIQELVEFAVLHTPSAFNSQTARVVLLLKDQHKKLWNIVKETLRKIVPEEDFPKTENKINSFAAGHGTVLFYEDRMQLDTMMKEFALYSEMIPGFSMNSAGMLQYVVWTLLRDVGLGASLQHYGNLIEAEVARTWNLPVGWKLIAQMPFGKANSEPGNPEKKPIEEQFKLFA
jgi:Predicted oxidoreductase related to nitroreductase